MKMDSINRNEPVFVFLTGSQEHETLFPGPKHQALADQQQGSYMSSTVERASSLLAHGPMVNQTSAEALRRPEATSEPSCSARASLESEISSTPNAAANTTLGRRKSVTFEDTPSVGRPLRRPSSSRDSLASSSPFHSYSKLPNDDFNIGFVDHTQSSLLSGSVGVGNNNCTLSLHNNASSAPIGCLDASIASATEALEQLRLQQQQQQMELPSPFFLQQQQQLPLMGRPAGRRSISSTSSNLTAAQRLRTIPQDRVLSAPDALETFTAAAVTVTVAAAPQLGNLAYDVSKRGGLPPPPSTPEAEPFHDISGELYGGHLVSSRASMESNDALKSGASSSCGGGGGGGSGTASSRSSLDVLLHSTAPSTLSRQSLDSLTGLGLFRGEQQQHQWGEMPSHSSRRVSSSSAGSSSRASSLKQLSAAQHLQNARASMESFSLRPSSSSSSHDTRSSIDVRSLRSFANSAQSVTVVTEQTRSSGAAAGPSAGAMASSVVDQYIPGESISTHERGKMQSSSPRSGVLGGVVGQQHSYNSSGGRTTAAMATFHTRQEPITALLDADLHDTFGAHAWYCGPSIPGSTPSGYTPLHHQHHHHHHHQSTTTASASARTNVFSAAAAAAALKNNNNTNSSSSNLPHPSTTTTKTTAPKSISSPPSSTATMSTSPAGSGSGSGSGASFSRAWSSGSGGSSSSSRLFVGTKAGTAKHLELTSMPGQHSVTLHDAQCIVPSYDFLRQRRLVKAQQDQRGEESYSGGYIAEAKRVLNEAMCSASRQEAELRDSSYSGAIGPLLRHLSAAIGDDSRTRAALHTLSLMESNLPNRNIIADLEGRRILASTLRTSQALDIREQAVSLLWDLDSAAGKDAAPVLEAEDVFALLEILEATADGAIASHALHFVEAVLTAPTVAPRSSAAAASGTPSQQAPSSSSDVDVAAAGNPPLAEKSSTKVVFTSQQLSMCAMKIVKEVCAHKHRLQDAAQYTLGSLLGALLNDPRATSATAEAATSALLEVLQECRDPEQCQVLLTVLSSLAGKPRLLAVMVKGAKARDAVLRCGQKSSDPRLRARALSLIKVLNKEEVMHAAVGQSWYFGPE